MKDIKVGTKLICKSVVMVVTGETETMYLGYSEYKGKNVGACNMEKQMFNNPHYASGIQIVNQ